jgi:predicted Fe-Mo cluster-binding NifX family protein
MKAAFSFWENRIAPVFDSARQICIVEVQSGRIVQENREQMTGDLPVQMALRLKELGVATLVCGAISRPLQEMLTSCGIQVVPFISGGLSEVIRAWISGKFNRSAFAMPGCLGGRCRRFGGLHGIGGEENIMIGMGQGGRGMGRGGQGRSQGGRRAGRGGGPLAAGPDGYCVCSQCGRKEPHQRGVPCFERKCPNCGAVMVRQQ